MMNVDEAFIDYLWNMNIHVQQFAIIQWNSLAGLITMYAMNKLIGTWQSIESLQSNSTLPLGS